VITLKDVQWIISRKPRPWYPAATCGGRTLRLGVALHTSAADEVCQPALGIKYFGSSETTRGNQISKILIYKIRYSPVKYESTYVVDINRINMNDYTCSNININCFPFFQTIISYG